MLKIRDILSGILLMILGILWGHLWVTEFLACPEWWYIGVNALLFGAGFYAAKYLPVSYRLTVPGLLLVLLSALDKSDLHSILMPLIFGIWYSSDESLIRQWRISRIFCGGLMIGGVLAGTWHFDMICQVSLFCACLLYGGLQISFRRMAEYTLLAAMLCSFFSFRTETQEKSPEFDPGTIISGFSLIEAQKRDLDIVFLGGNMHSIDHASRIIMPAGRTIAVSNLPGTVPQCDMIVVSTLPESGNGGVKALLRSLNPGGILIMPENLCFMLPELEWHTLPGSDGKYAAAAPGRNLELDPDKMDNNLNLLFSAYPDHAPLHGALAGLLVDFKPGKFTYPPPVRKNFLNHLIPAAAALILLALIWLARTKNPSSENGRIMINCAGYTMMAALTINNIFSGIAGHPALRSLIMAVAIMWIFRRPVDTNLKNNYTHFAGMLACAALLAAWNGSWVFSITALVFGGFAFASLDGELCGKRDENTEPVRFLGIAAGAFISGWLLYSGLSPLIIFAAAAALRFWSWFRS